MKKLTAIILSLVLVLSLSIPAMATTVTETGTQTADVKAKYVDNVTTPDVYSVDITWGSMEFTYTESGTKTWDPATHTYTTTNASSAWAPATEGADAITITNHSNLNIKTIFGYTPKTGYEAITGRIFYEETDLSAYAFVNINSAEGTAYENAFTGTFTVRLFSIPTSLGTEAVAVGTVTVTIA